MAVQNARFVLSSNPNQPLKQSTKVSSLTLLTGASGNFELCKVQPFINNFQPNPDSNLVDFETDTAGGLDKQSVTWNSAWADGVYGAQVNSNSNTFNITGALPAVIYGWILLTEDGGDWLSATVLDEPYPVPEADSIELVVSLVIT